MTKSDVNRLQLILDRVDTHSEYGNAKFASMGDFDDFKAIVQELYARTFHATSAKPPLKSVEWEQNDLAAKSEAKPVEALVEALKRAEKLQDWYLTALMDIERVRAKYGATGFPVDFHGREMEWVQDRARMAIENDPSARALDSDKEQRNG